MTKVVKTLPFIVITIILIVFCARLFQWQIIDAEKYETQAEMSSSYYSVLDAPRGEILDVNGVPLAGTEISYNVVMNALNMESNRNESITEIIDLMKEHDIQWINRLPIVIGETGEFEFAENMDSEINYLKSDQMLSMQDYATADQCFQELVKKYGCDDYDRETAFEVITIRYGMTRVQFSMSEPYVIASTVPIEFVEIVSESMGEMPGIEIKVSSERVYDDGALAPHVLGTLGLISQDQYNKQVEEGNVYSSDNISGYTYNDIVGRSGIESVYEEYLRGDNGKLNITYETGSDEAITNVEVIPKAGDNVYLTLDSGLQEVLNYSLKTHVDAAETEDCIAGAAVVLDVESFGVLGISSYPTYDLNLYQNNSNYYNELLEDETKPLFNRALDGGFAPGSVMKPVVGLAGLQEDVITAYSTVFCNGSYDYYPTNPLGCLGIHGNSDVTNAMAYSCNVFFGDTGRQLGIERMEVYANLFSLGEPTGIELPESSGLMTNPESYESIYGIDYIDGITVHAAIGQAINTFTPIQLATFAATIANDGVRYETHLLDRVTDFENNQVIEVHEPEVVETIEIDQENFEIIQNSMKMVNEYGTASKVFNDYGIAIAAKTGTAENEVNSDNTLFVAYAPYDNPEIAISVVIEYGADGTLSQLVAKDVFDYYFFGKTLEEIMAEDVISISE